MEWRLLRQSRCPLTIVISSRRNIFLTIFLGATWVVALAFGARTMFRYETTPGRNGQTSLTWPAGSMVPQPTEKPTLIMLAHPHCPCTRASVGELAQVMAHAAGKVNAYVLFVKPAAAGAHWDETDLRRSAAAIPGVTALTDENGTEAARFGAETSGQTLLFAADGTLVFAGGITASRGHAGSNAGESAVLAAINQETVSYSRTPVFGCSLQKHTSAEEPMPCSK